MEKIKLHQEIIDHAIELLTNNKYQYEGVFGCDLHHELFNIDYYVIGYAQSEEFLERWGGTWKAIHRVKNYEEAMFGEVSTDLSDCEKVANMIAYIEGESVLMECKTIERCWDKRLSDDDIIDLIQELENL